jgi:hypothetical protein
MFVFDDDVDADAEVLRIEVAVDDVNRKSFLTAL